MRILLVDDDIDISDELKEWLVECGHFVEAVYSGPEALEHLGFYEYDLIVLDYQLPGKKGQDVCREFRARGGVTPIIMLTGNSASDFQNDCLEAGVNNFLEKPFPLEELSEIVKVYCKSS